MIGLTAKTFRALKIGKGASFSLLKLLPFPPPPVASGFPFINHLARGNSTYIANPVALEMIRYATSVARDSKTEDSYARGLLILEQCNATHQDDNSKGLVELARSSLLFERGSYEEAIERLHNIQNLSLPSISVKVAAAEALAGVYLEYNQDEAATVAAELTSQLLGKVPREINNGNNFEVLESRIEALKGLIELIHGNLELAQSYFQREQGVNVFFGSAALTYGEYLHGTRKFSAAKKMYMKVIEQMSKIKDFSDPIYLGACNMISEEVSIAATCSLGQLEAHMGNFVDAEKLLTTSLKKVEECFGSHHPKVGIILTCIALMYQLKSTTERSSSLLVQEGLFRKAIELLKAPTLEMDGFCENLHRRDIIAFARGGYAETLIVQQSRKAEGLRLQHWAESVWRNRWMSLAEALELSESSPRLPVIDTRISRVL